MNDRHFQLGDLVRTRASGNLMHVLETKADGLVYMSGEFSGVRSTFRAKPENLLLVQKSNHRRSPSPSPGLRS